MDRQLTALLLPYLRRNARSIAAGLLALLAVDAVQLFVPRVLRLVIDGVTRAPEPGFLWEAFFLILGIASGIVIFRFAWRFFLFGASRRMEREMRNALHLHLIKLPIRFHDAHKVGDLMAHVTNDLQSVREAVALSLVMLTDAVLWSLATVSMMLWIDVPVTLRVLSPLLVIALVAWILGREVRRRFYRVQEQFSRLSDLSAEIFGGIQTVQVFGLQPRVARLFREEAHEYYRRNLRLARVWAIQIPLIMALSSASVALLLWAGGARVLEGTLSLGDFAALHAYLAMLTWPMMALGWVVNLFQRGLASLRRIARITAQTPEAPDTGASLPPAPALEIRDLTFRFSRDRPPVLCGVSLCARPGERIGLIGETGSGKSTLFALLTRLYNPPEGTIFLHGKDILSYAPREIRRRIVLVPQESFFFSASLRHNLDPRDEHSDAQLWRALELAQLADEVRRMPARLETTLGERGYRLSGGQRQRLALARALLRDPDILILDDALSSVDSENEQAILERLFEALPETTFLVVSHRIPLMRRMDRLYLLHRGAIIAEGTHEELLRRSPRYAHLWDLYALEVPT